MNAQRVGVALRVLGSAAARDLVVNRPLGVIVYARSLDPIEVRWLVLGMDAAEAAPLANAGVHGEDVEVRGTILGRVYRLFLHSDALDTVADLPIRRTVAA